MTNVKKGDNFHLAAVGLAVITIIIFIIFTYIQEKKCISNYNNNVILEEGDKCTTYYLKEISDKKQLEEINETILSN